MCVNLLFFCTFVGKRWNGVTLESTMGRNLIQFAHFNPWERRTFQGNKGIWKQIPVFVKSTMMIVFEQKHQQSRPSQTKARVGDPWIQKRSLSSAPQNNMWHKTRSADLCWVTVHQSGPPLSASASLPHMLNVTFGLLKIISRDADYQGRSKSCCFPLEPCSSWGNMWEHLTAKML